MKRLVKFTFTLPIVYTLFFFAGLTVSSFGVSGARGADVSAPSEKSYDALELAKKCENVWRELDSIDLTYRFQSNDMTDLCQWIFDLKSNREAERTLKYEGFNGKPFQWYFDGSTTFESHGIDLESVVKTERESYERNGELGRYGRVYDDGRHPIGSQMGNNAYRAWFPNGKQNFFTFSKEDSQLSFVEIVEKYPTSAPERKIDENNDVLWSFFLFPNEDAKEQFGKEPCSYREITVNESKGYLLHQVKIVNRSFDPNDDRTFTSYCKTSEYLQINGRFFPKKTAYIDELFGPEAAQFHEVVDLKINAKIDFDPYKIPQYTKVDLHAQSDSERIAAIWGPDDKPIRTFATEDEYAQYLQQFDVEIITERKEAVNLQDKKQTTTRVVLCLLGLTLVAIAVLLKRKKSNDVQ